MLSRIEDYFPYVRHKLKATRKSLGVVLYRHFADWVFSEKTYECLDDMVSYVQAHPDWNMAFIASHRSETDWAEEPFQFITHNIKTVIQSGANLYLGPLDEWLRSAGGFKVYREETTVRSPNWLLDTLLEFLEEKIGVELNAGIEITKELAEQIYRAYFAKTLTDGYNVLIFPEYSEKRDEEKRRTIKYGRSYSGELLPFSALPLQVPYFFQKTHPEKNLVFYPLSITYERVIEDQNFARLEALKAQGASTKRIYIEDYWWNLTFRLHQRPSRLHLAFGEPIPMKELPLRGVASRSKLAPYLRDEVGKLSVLYPTQLVGLALDPVLENDGMNITDLKERMAYVRDQAAELGERYVQHLPTDMDEALEQAHEQFWQPNRLPYYTREIARLDGSTVAIHRPDVLMQYANHCRHLFSEKLSRTTLDAGS
jgi:1-acyl-sn-glycerol-3-phosphate acyltransferase